MIDYCFKYTINFKKYIAEKNTLINAYYAENNMYIYRIIKN